MKEAEIFNKHLTGIIDSESDIENTINIYWDSEINKHYFELWTKISGTIQINQIVLWLVKKCYSTQRIL